MADTPVDLSHLARYTGGDKSLNSEILRLFDGQVSEMVTQLLAVLEQRDARKCVVAWVSATVSLLRISAVSTRSSAGWTLVFLCSPPAHLPVASEWSAGIVNLCLTIGDSRSKSIATASLAGNVCSSASSSSQLRWASRREDGLCALCSIGMT